MAAKGKSKPLRGYSKIGKRWRTPRGKVISDYEYRSRIVKKYGWKNYSEYTRFKKSQPYMKVEFDILNNKENYDDKGKYIGPARDYQFSSDVYKVIEKEKNKETIITTYGQRKRADESELGRMLIALGRIPLDFEWEYA